MQKTDRPPRREAQGALPLGEASAERETPAGPGRELETNRPRSNGAGELQEALIDWFLANGRELPWRRTRDPYALWVSEIMLQQTQVQSVIPYYERFMARFPTLAALAAADEDAVIRAWAGLGYYARARNLRRGAQLVIEQHGGEVPHAPEALLRLPGVGRYTAGAIASIAYNVPAPILDGNVIRILCRIFGLRGDPKRAPLHARLWELAADLMPPGRASIFNPAMMELGATICTPARPACDRCPVAPWCRARVEGVQEQLPETAAVPALEPVAMVAGIIWEGQAGSPPSPPIMGEAMGACRVASPIIGGLGGRSRATETAGEVAKPRVLICRGLAPARARPVGIAAMWQFPNGEQQPGETSARAVRRLLRELLGIDAEVGAPAATFRHGVTRYRVTLTAHECPRWSGTPAALDCAEWTWADLDALEGFALPAAHRRLAAQVCEALGGDEKRPGQLPLAQDWERGPGGEGSETA